MRTTGGKGESASLLLGVRVGLILHLGRENVGPPANFGRFRGQIGHSGGASATGGALERGDGGRAPAQPDRWRPWRRPHWPLPAVSPAPSRGGKCQFRPRRKGGESASSDPVGKGGKVPVQTPSERGGKCHLWRWRRSAAAGRLRGGAVWRQRGFAFLRPIPPPKLEAPRQYQAQRGLF